MSIRNKKCLAVALVVILVCSIMASILQTDFGTVRIRDITLETSSQQQLHALVFSPRYASAYKKVPVVITMHSGFYTAEFQDAASIELSKRGICVIAIDAYSHGFSSNVPVNLVTSEMGEGCGIVSMVEYVASGVMDFVDTDHIGIMGHSMGGRSVRATLMHYGQIYDSMLAEAALETSDGGTKITESELAAAKKSYKIDAALATGVTPGLFANNWNLVHCNTGIIYGSFEEGGYSNSTGNANVLGSTSEALTMVHTVDESVTSVANGKFYGSIADGTLRVLYQPAVTHLMGPTSPAMTEDVISFFKQVWNIDTHLMPDNQSFFAKELFNLGAMVALFCLIIPFGDMLLSCPGFAVLRAEPATEKKVIRKKEFLLMVLCSGFVAILAGILDEYIDRNGLIFKATPFANAKIFPCNGMNIAIIWLTCMAIWYLVWCRISGAKLCSCEKDKSGNIWKTILLPVCIVGLFYGVVWFCKWMFNTDFRFWTQCVKTFNNEKLVYFIQYLPFFFLFAMAYSIYTNSFDVIEGCTEERTTTLIAIGGLAGWLVLELAQYGKLFATGSVLFTDWNAISIIFFLGWQVFLAPYYLRTFYRMTGKHWAGALTLSAIYTMIGITGTTIQSAML